jgi:hypothetical protein
MPADRRLALHAALPDRYAHLKVLASTIDHRGRLIALLTDPGTKSGTHEIPLTGLDLRFSKIDTIGDGIVLASARCEPPGVPPDRYGEPIPEEELHLTANIQVFDADGMMTAAFYAGDAIYQLMTDRQGNIWTSYSDESSYWFPSRDGTRSYGFIIGLACWDQDGALLWMPGGEGLNIVWMDCYALNVGRELVHASPYTDFPLVELDVNGIRSVTPNPITRCTGLAIDGNELAFLDKLRLDGHIQWQIRRGRREDGKVVETSRENLLLPDGRVPTTWARGRIGRDGRLWLHEENDPRHWYRYDLTD